MNTLRSILYVLKSKKQTNPALVDAVVSCSSHVTGVNDSSASSMMSLFQGFQNVLRLFLEDIFVQISVVHFQRPRENFNFALWLLFLTVCKLCFV